MANNIFQHQNKKWHDELIRIALTLAIPGKGILITDESISTIGKQLKATVYKNNSKTLQQYQLAKYTNEPNFNEYISGVVMDTEDGIPFAQLLKTRGILSGIRVDSGVTLLFGTNIEFTTRGLEDLEIRCKMFKKDGCDFARWRCVIRIGSNMPSSQAILKNANNLGRYAFICQSQGMVPIIESQILPDGEHDIEYCSHVTENVITSVYKALNDHQVFLEGTILCVNMVTSGLLCKQQATSQEIALSTVLVLRRTVPAAVPGIVILSGSQSEEEFLHNLNAISQVLLHRPWEIIFSYSHALPPSLLLPWEGSHENNIRDQENLLKRVKAYSEASIGKFKGNYFNIFGALGIS